MDFDREPVKQTRKKRNAHVPKIIGWREWFSLPDLGIQRVKAKIDTGARTSCLHAYEIEEVHEGRKWFVKFKVHPMQRNSEYTVKAKAELIEKRCIKDSGGKETLRPVIRTRIVAGDLSWEIELTLISRDEMGFRMLLGRKGINEDFLVHPSQSFLLTPFSEGETE
jgi:hypothetical protein